jgi:hypothetical protein
MESWMDTALVIHTSLHTCSSTSTSCRALQFCFECTNALFRISSVWPVKFCSRTVWKLPCSRVPVRVFHAPIPSVFVAAGTAGFLSVVRVCVSETCMNDCLAKWIIPCLAPLFRVLGSVYRKLLGKGLFQLVVPAPCFNKQLSSNGRRRLLRYFGF